MQDQVRLLHEVAVLGEDDGVLHILPDEVRTKTFTPERPIDPVMTDILGMIGKIGERIIDVGTQQKLAIGQGTHAN